MHRAQTQIFLPITSLLSIDFLSTWILLLSILCECKCSTKYLNMCLWLHISLRQRIPDSKFHPLHLPLLKSMPSSFVYLCHGEWLSPDDSILSLLLRILHTSVSLLSAPTAPKSTNPDYPESPNWSPLSRQHLDTFSLYSRQFGWPWPVMTKAALSTAARTLTSALWSCTVMSLSFCL